MKKKERTGSVLDTIEEVLKLKEQGITSRRQMIDIPTEPQKRKDVSVIVSKPKKKLRILPVSSKSKKIYKPIDRTQITFFINNNVHQKLKDICDANRSRGIKTAVSDVINLAIVKHLESLEIGKDKEGFSLEKYTLKKEDSE